MSPNASHSGAGVYDPEQWAVVFKYSRVRIAPGVKVTFRNHPSRAPVVWLVDGPVEIAGTLSLNGQGMVASPALAEPGPGGFRGGMGTYGPGAGRSDGFGLGGGGVADLGSGRTANQSGVHVGNPSLLPLTGGGGGTGASQNSDVSGGAGGGAILIATTGDLILNGRVEALGGPGGSRWPGGTTSGYGGGGAGGGIRLVAAHLRGTGAIEALGGPGGEGNQPPGGRGLVRLESLTRDAALQVQPDPSVVDLTEGANPLIWLPAAAPLVRIVSVGGQAAPLDPRAAFGALGADVQIPTVSTAPLVVETRNVEPFSLVSVRMTPRSDGRHANTRLYLDANAVSAAGVLIWTNVVPVPPGYSALQVHVVRP
jgi:hypothetical protein